MENLKEEIKLLLQQELPGIKAQIEMAPKGRISSNYNNNPLGAIQSSVLILLFPTNLGLSFVLIKRSAGAHVHSGQIALPGGKLEAQDQNLVETALRESYEEIGINPDGIHILGNLTRLYIPVSNYSVLPVVGYINQLPKLKPDPAEVAEIIEFQVSDLFLKKNYFIKEMTIKGSKYQIPCLKANEETIWGATAMILSEFKQIIKPLEI